MTFLSPEATKAGLVENKALGFAPETYPQCLGCSSYRFPSLQLKNISVKFWGLFEVRKPREQDKMKTRHRWLGFAPEHTHNVWGAVRIVCCQYSWKIFQSNFGRFCWLGNNRSKKSWKSGTDDSALYPKKPTLFGVQLLLFRINTTEECFRRILMSLPSPDTTGTRLEQAKLETEPGWLSFTRKTYLQCLGCSSHHFPSIRLKSISVQLWRNHRSNTSWKLGKDDSVFAFETYPQCLGCSFYCLLSVQLKYISVKFWCVSWPGNSQTKKSWKSGTDDSTLHSKNTHIVWGIVLIVSR